MLMPGAEPFFFPGSDKGILFIHGFTGSPAELRELGERLHAEAGYTTSGLLLPGHGTTPDALNTVNWQSWLDAVESAFQQLQKSCKQISLAGMSMGSLLVLTASLRLPVHKLIVMSTPIFLYDWRSHFLWLAKRAGWIQPKGNREINAEQRFNVSYDRMPFHGIEETLRLRRYCQRHVLKKVTAPCLIIQSKAEHTVAPTSATYIYDHIASAAKQLLWLENSKHVVTLYEERDKVFTSIKDFLKE